MREWFARTLLAVIVVGLPASLFGYTFRGQNNTPRVINITAAAPENGGFQPDSFRVAQGETITLRFKSVDVTHGIAIGPGLDVDLGYVDPGQIKEVTLHFDQAGTYTFYCNVWCSPDHWRMRGVAEVYDAANPNALIVPQRDPVIEQLIEEGVNIDTIHLMNPDNTHREMPIPSASRGAELNLLIPSIIQDETWQRTHTPQAAMEELANLNPTASQQDLADVVAYLWVNAVDAKAVELYNKNCAACHGQGGNADGPMAGQTVIPPVAFANTDYLLSMRGDVLYAKIRRGGMGTDMPNFGTVFTQAETWQLVNYLWSLGFKSS